MEGRDTDRAAEFPGRGPDHRQQGVGGGGDSERGAHVDAVRHFFGSEPRGAVEGQCQEESEGAGVRVHIGRGDCGGVYRGGDGQDAV